MSPCDSLAIVSRFLHKLTLSRSEHLCFIVSFIFRYLKCKLVIILLVFHNVGTLFHLENCERMAQHLRGEGSFQFYLNESYFKTADHSICVEQLSTYLLSLVLNSVAFLKREISCRFSDPCLLRPSIRP